MAQDPNPNPETHPASSSATCSVERTSRSVIEHKLLTTLEDGNTVAAIMSKQDLEDIIFAIDTHFGLGKQRMTRLRGMADGFRQLHREAFPPNGELKHGEDK